jgi:uncharacterized membrane protein
MQESSSRALAFVAYAFAPLGALLAWLSAGEDGDLRRHARQALVAGLLAVVVVIALGLVPRLGCLAAPAGAGFWLYMLWCGVRAYQGRDVEIPFVSRIG